MFLNIDVLDVLCHKVCFAAIVFNSFVFQPIFCAFKRPHCVATAALKQAGGFQRVHDLLYITMQPMHPKDMSTESKCSPELYAFCEEAVQLHTTWCREMQQDNNWHATENNPKPVFVTCGLYLAARTSSFLGGVSFASVPHAIDSKSVY